MNRELILDSLCIGVVNRIASRAIVVGHYQRAIATGALLLVYGNYDDAILTPIKEADDR